MFGTILAKDWLWTIDFSLGYVGQEIISGPAIPLHMLAEAIVGWAILSPVAKHNEWANGNVVTERLKVEVGLYGLLRPAY